MIHKCWYFFEIIVPFRAVNEHSRSSAETTAKSRDMKMNGIKKFIVSINLICLNF